MTFRTPNMPANGRPVRLGAVVSADMTGYGGFYANTVSACFWKSYTMPSGETLKGLSMRLTHADVTTDFAFKDAEGFRNSRESKCWKWSRPATIGNDWDFGEVVTVSLHWDGSNPNANATGKPVITSSEGISITETGTEGVAVDLSGISDPEGMTKAEAFTTSLDEDSNEVKTYTYPQHAFKYQWIIVDGNNERIGANGAIYRVVGADRGKRLKVRVTFKDDSGNTETLDSNSIPINRGSLDIPTTVEMLPGEVAVWSTTFTPSSDSGCRGCDSDFGDQDFIYDGRTMVVYHMYTTNNELS